MKILHTADWHVGRTIRGRSRLDEHRAVLGEVAEIARSEAVDLVLIAGDQFDTSSPAPDAETLVYRTLLDLAEVAPVLMVAGNHDHPRRLEAVAPLLELGRVAVGAHLARPEKGGVVTPAGLPVRVAMIPFQSQRGIVGADDLMALDADQHGGKYERRMAALVDVLCRGIDSDRVNVVMGHVMVHGGVTGGGERTAHVFDYSVPAQVFPPELSYVALGHLHRHQRIPAAAPVWYSGSLLQLDFGEVEDRKGVVVVDVEPGLPASVELHPVESGRRLRTLFGTLAQIEAAADVVGADDYVKVVIDEPATAGLADIVRSILPQAVDVTIDPGRRTRLRPDRPSRVGRSRRDLFVDYLGEADAMEDRVVALFDELLEEAHEA